MRRSLYFIIGLLAFYLNFSLAHAMVSNGIHKRKDYIQFAQSQSVFRAVCYVYNHTKYALQTGVLIAPRLVLTAAHGVMDLEPNNQNIDVTFGDKMNDLSNHKYKVTKVHIHSEYQFGHDHHSPHVDMAILELDRAVEGVSPVPLLSSLKLHKKDTFLVGTFGSVDYRDSMHVDKRAFVLPEWERVSMGGSRFDNPLTEKRILIGSIFFDPHIDTDTCEKKITIADPESKQRSYKACRKWQKMGKPPYALAMPGTSGAPVFIRRDHQYYTLGLVSSFSHLSDTSFAYGHGDSESKHIMHSHLNKIYNKYQSIFVLPYLAHILPFEPTGVMDPPVQLIIDPEFKKIILESPVG